MEKFMINAISSASGEDIDFLNATVAKVGASIKNSGSTIYNGNDENMSVPTLMKSAELHPTYVGKETSLGGWTDVQKITVIDFEKLPKDAEHRERVLRSELNDTTVDMWRDNIDEFNDDDVVAIHIDDTDGSWYEYVTNGTTPALEEDAA